MASTASPSAATMASTQDLEPRLYAQSPHGESVTTISVATSATEITRSAGATSITPTALSPRIAIGTTITPRHNQAPATIRTCSPEMNNKTVDRHAAKDTSHLMRLRL